MSKYNNSNWKPLVSQQGIEMRAVLYAQIREFFASRNVLEVDTPIINRCTVTDPHIDSICISDKNRNVYLHTSPEYAMKRLLAVVKRDTYQVCKVFRAGEQGRYHHPEFTMLEWYRIAWNYQDLMQEVDELVKTLLQRKFNFSQTKFITYQEIFKDYCELDPWQAKHADYLRACETARIVLRNELSIQEYQELLLDQAIAPKLPKDCLTFIYNFPVHHAALARINYQGAAERFELYLGHIELANGFQELADADEQLARFTADNLARQQMGKAKIEIDQQFIAALQAGLPECAGVALGIDRLLMIILGLTEIKNVLTFSSGLE